MRHERKRERTRGNLLTDSPELYEARFADPERIAGRWAEDVLRRYGAGPRALDIGRGTGRDAGYLHGAGRTVGFALARTVGFALAQAGADEELDQVSEVWIVRAAVAREADCLGRGPDGALAGGRTRDHGGPDDVRPTWKSADETDSAEPSTSTSERLELRG